MAELFRFRCYHCQKLMGAPPSKFGKKVHCPRCGVELIVPTPEEDDTREEEDDESPDAVNLADLGVSLAPVPPRRAAATSLRDPGFGEPETSPVAFLESAPPSPGPSPDADSDEEDGDPALPEIAVPVDLAARASPLTGRRPIPTADDASTRRRDVVLPRTVALAWALSALLGLGFAFIAGLLIGHYLWR